MPTPAEVRALMGIQKDAGILDLASKLLLRMSSGVGSGVQRSLNYVSGKQRWGTNLVDSLEKPSGPKIQQFRQGNIRPGSVDPRMYEKIKDISARRRERARANLGAFTMGAVGAPLVSTFYNALTAPRAEDRIINGL